MGTYVEDVLTGQPRIVSPARAKRLGPRPEGCPFCVGNEEQTPPEIDRVESAEGVWAARVVPNLFPLSDAHEVIIMTSRHVTTVRELDEREWARAIMLWLRRLDAHRARQDTHYAHLFINDGRAAGASLDHTHSQLVVVPRSAATASLTRNVVDAATCAACQLVGGEGGSVVWSSDDFVLVASPTPRISEGLLLLPRRHEVVPFGPSLDTLPAAMWAAVHAVPEADFNCWIVCDTTVEAHWYVEFAPRTSIQAGVELGLGIGVSIVDASEAAARAQERLAAATASR